MRLQAAIRGDLEKIMRDELDAATGGVQRGLRRAQQLVKGQLRGQVVRAGLGERLAKTWRDKDRRGRELYWANQGLDAAAMVVSSAQQIIEGHMGATIRARSGRYLAIPTEEALRMRRGRRRMSPRTFPGGMKRLRYVPRPNGPDLLVLDTGGKTKAGRYRKGSSTKVMFVLVRQVSLKQRLPDVAGVVTRVEHMLPAILLREYGRKS